MFKNCYSLKSINLINLNTSKIITMSSLFENCFKLKSLNLSHFITYTVIDMSYMFNNCSNLNNLTIYFNTMKVKKMEYMFGSCTKIKSLNIITFNTLNCINFTGMFENDKNLDLYLNFNNTSNLLSHLPSYVNIHDISSNVEIA